MIYGYTSNLKVIFIMITVILHKAKAVTPITNWNRCWDLDAYGGSHCSLKTFDIQVFQQSLHLIENTDMEI